MSKRRRSKTVATVILPISLAGFLAACDAEHASLSDCEGRHGAGNCGTRPSAVLMTAQNRPSYRTKDACTGDFGERSCEQDRRSGYYRPYYYQGRTFFYPYGTPGYVGYYNGLSTARPAFGPSRYVSTSRITTPHISRGGFGSTSVGRSGGT